VPVQVTREPSHKAEETSHAATLDHPAWRTRDARLPAPEAWPHSPVLVSLSRSLPETAQWRVDDKPMYGPLPINTLERIPFSTPIFEGVAIINVAGVGPAPVVPANPDGGGPLSGCGQGRTLEVSISGRFLRRLRFDEVRGATLQTSQTNGNKTCAFPGRDRPVFPKAASKVASALACPCCQHLCITPRSGHRGLRQGSSLRRHLY
jgi:hypothetical protein